MTGQPGDIGLVTESDGAVQLVPDPEGRLRCFERGSPEGDGVRQCLRWPVADGPGGVLAELLEPLRGDGHIGQRELNGLEFGQGLPELPPVPDVDHVSSPGRTAASRGGSSTGARPATAPASVVDSEAPSRFGTRKGRGSSGPLRPTCNTRVVRPSRNVPSTAGLEVGVRQVRPVVSHQSDGVGVLESERGQTFSDRIRQCDSTGGPAGESRRLELRLLAHIDLPQTQSAEVVSDPACDGWGPAPPAARARIPPWSSATRRRPARTRLPPTPVRCSSSNQIHGTGHEDPLHLYGSRGHRRRLGVAPVVLRRSHERRRQIVRDCPTTIRRARPSGPRPPRAPAS